MDVVVSLDPNTIASSPFAALVLALIGLFMFVNGAIVSGRLYSELRDAIKALTASLDLRNKLEQDAINRHGRDQ